MKFMDKITQVSRALITEDGKILLCQKPDEDFYFFPGGNIEFGEEARATLIRELKEELNVTAIKIDFIGTVENIFEQDGQRFHEINFAFEVKLKEYLDKSLENHINFFWIDLEKIKQEKILPVVLKEKIIDRLAHKNI